MKNLMNHSLRFVLTISAVVLVSNSSFARSSSGDGVLLSLNPYFATSSDNESTEGSVSTTATEATAILMDVNIGYQMGNGLYLGLLYMSDSMEVKAGSTTKSTASGFGPSVGFMKNGWFGHFHYILSSESDSDTSTSAKWTKGTGMQVDVGYLMPISGPFSIGVELAYRSLEYGTFQDNAGTESTANKLKSSGIKPKIRFTFIF